MSKLFCYKSSHAIFTWLFFLIIATSLYHRIVGNFFVSDDWHWLWLAQNTTWSWRIFLTNYEGGQLGGSYNPLLLVIFKIFFNLFGLKYFYYHLLSIIVHSLNAFLVYILTKKVFNFFGLNIWPKLSLIAGILFLLWPTQVEAVAWLSAWPHLWATFFYLLALLGYFNFRNGHSSKHLFASSIFLIAALLIKEIALSLPLLIIFLEIYKHSQNKSVDNNNGIHSFYIIILWLICLVFLYFRFLATGTLFGYYGQHQLGVSISQILANFTGYLNELITASYDRILFFKVWYKYTGALAIMTALCLGTYIFYLRIKKHFVQLALLLMFIISLLPVLPLSMNRLTFEGERYLYLPSAFFIMWLLYASSFIFKKKHVNYILLLIFVVISMAIVWHKITIWRQASVLSHNIVSGFANLKINDGQTLVTVGLPDNLGGAQVFRNNLQQAINFTYPQKQIKIITLPIYTSLNQNNQRSSLLRWRTDELGWFAESADASFVVTGLTSLTQNGFYWELWHYNYQNYTANTIRLMPQTEELKNKLKNEEIRILIFDKGSLKILE